MLGARGGRRAGSSHARKPPTWHAQQEPSPSIEPPIIHHPTDSPGGCRWRRAAHSPQTGPPRSRWPRAGSQSRHTPGCSTDEGRERAELGERRSWGWAAQAAGPGSGACPPSRRRPHCMTSAAPPVCAHPLPVSTPVNSLVMRLYCGVRGRRGRRGVRRGRGTWGWTQAAAAAAGCRPGEAARKASSAAPVRKGTRSRAPLQRHDSMEEGRRG